MSEQEQIDVVDEDEDPVRREDRERLELITAATDLAGDSALVNAILHPHAVLDTAQRRVDEMGLTQPDPGGTAAVMGVWVDGFLAGQRAMAGAIGLDLDADPLEDESEPRS